MIRECSHWVFEVNSWVSSCTQQHLCNCLVLVQDCPHQCGVAILKYVCSRGNQRLYVFTIYWSRYLIGAHPEKVDVLWCSWYAENHLRQRLISSPDRAHQSLVYQLATQSNHRCRIGEWASLASVNHLILQTHCTHFMPLVYSVESGTGSDQRLRDCVRPLTC